jgi:hypothetical protein
MSDNYIVVGKLGDHCRKLVELKMLKEKKEHLQKVLDLQITTIEGVVKNWPLDEQNQELRLEILLVNLELEMHKLDEHEQALRLEAKQQKWEIDKTLVQDYLTSQDKCREYVGLLNTLGSSGVSELS